MIKKIKKILEKLTCKHDGRIVSFFPNKDDTYWKNELGEERGHFSGLVFRCCMKCKKVWAEDYKE